MKVLMRWLSSVAFALLIPIVSPAQAPVDFSSEIQPLFQKRCILCHGPNMQASGLRLDRRDAALRVIQPGNSSASRIVAMVSGTGPKVMPPVGDRLTPQQISLLKTWIDQGAKWPEAVDATVETTHWSFRPIQ
ncbi:MAG: c-type cytochrome, partial [Acidobacteriota bacterium]|nr:c-type cytochrome [Acidobacteriota bacterium]